MNDTIGAHSGRSGFQCQPYFYPGQQITLGDIWCRLGAGEFKIKHAQHAHGRCVVYLTRNSIAGDNLTTLEWQTAERILCGDLAKVIADEFGISCSTVCVYWQSVIASLCDRSVASLAHAFLVLCACATRNTVPTTATVDGITEMGDVVISAELGNEALLRTRLSRAEYEIVQAIVLGKASQEISRERKTSPRTIANQLNAIYRKLGISGRRELVVAALTQRSAL